MKMRGEIWNPIELMQLHDCAQLISWSLILLTLDDRVMPKFKINEKNKLIIPPIAIKTIKYFVYDTDIRVNITQKCDEN